ncbi:hypothetical protein PHLH8_35390 [Pseudomonas sp. Pc102]|uniref:hypothetical protein n=1 Tax=Pseudomonas sp. Pc102 TaxID=2678261 RepID=UPI001BCD01F9|nr:hypothetical protein [Pseudomonas sp. Pc102]BBP83897.1 hypothetical protein PHLH8_35390 [Pseudomonas sp. Pc102]
MTTWDQPARRWLVTYRMEGEVRQMLMRARNVPNLKAVAFSIYHLEFPDQPCPSTSRDNVESWLGARGITLEDVQLYQPPRR